MKHALTGEQAEAFSTFHRCGVCESWLTDDEAKNEECPGPASTTCPNAMRIPGQEFCPWTRRAA